MDCYLAQVLSVKQTHQWIPTIDCADGRCFSGKTWNHNQKEQAEKELEEMKKKLNVNIVKDDRRKSLALNKEERAWVHKCQEKGIEYKTILLKSIRERRYLTQEEMKV